MEREVRRRGELQETGRDTDVTATDHSPETERRLSEGRWCAGCDVPLQGRRRQCQYCSDRCRVRARRSSQMHRLQDVLEALDQALALGDLAGARQLVSAWKAGQ